MDEKIKDIVREIQSKHCGEAVETKLYHAIEKGIEIGKATCRPIFDIKLSAESFDYPATSCD